MKPKVTIDPSKVLKNIQKFTSDSSNLIEIAVNATALELITLAAQSAPVDTGALANSIKIIRNELGGFIKQVGSELPYALKQHENNREHSKYLEKHLPELEEKFKKRLSRIV